MSITKRGSLLAHAVIPAAVHVAQNIGVKANMLSGKLHETLANNILRKNNITGSPAVLAQRGILPEVGALSDEMHHLGGSISDALKANGISQGNITPTQGGILKDLFSGMYTKVFNHPEVDKHMPLIKSVLPATLGNKAPEGVHKIISAVTDPKNTPLKKALILRDLEKIHTSHGITDNLVKGVGTKLVTALSATTKPIASNIKSLTNGKKWNNISDAVGTTAMGLIDAPTGIINATKKIMTNTDIHKRFPALKTVADKLNRFTTTDPIKNMYNKGLQGRNIAFRPIRRFVDNIGFNPLISDAKNIAYDTGRLLHRWR